MDDSSTRPNAPLPGEQAREGALPLTTVFDLLSRSPRRRLLYRLRRHDDPAIAIDDLVRLLCDGDGDAHGEDDPRRVRAALHHVHLPKLAAVDVLEYDREDREVRYLGDPRLDALIEWGRGEEKID